MKKLIAIMLLSFSLFGCQTPESIKIADRKSYVYAMMKELNWEVVEKRIKKVEKIAKVMS